MCNLIHKVIITNYNQQWLLTIQYIFPNVIAVFAWRIEWILIKIILGK